MRQGYLAPAPTGVGVASAGAQLGGDKASVSIIDIEGSWCLTHVDLVGNGGLRGGVAIWDVGWRDHGTAVCGVMAAWSNGFGVTGIAPGASVSAFSHDTVGSAGAIQRSADLLGPGDILVLEMRRRGPLDDSQYRDDQLGYIAVEWWPDDIAAIRYAVGRGVTVIEAAGNGAQNLDGPFTIRPGRVFRVTGAILSMAPTRVLSLSARVLQRGARMGRRGLVSIFLTLDRAWTARDGGGRLRPGLWRSVSGPRRAPMVYGAVQWHVERLARGRRSGRLPSGHTAPAWRAVGSQPNP